MKKIIFLSILGMLMLQGCKTAPATATPVVSVAPVAAPVVVAKPVEMDPLKLMTNPNLGNCTACHSIPARPEIAAGDIGPPYVGMKHRFPDFAKLTTAIYDQRALKPQTIMPPFGRNKILTPEQINAIAQYIYQY